MSIIKPITLFYPSLGSVRDLWFVRLSGAGLGNGFFSYFHAVVLAQKHHGVVITPPWFALKLGPILRGEKSKRFYWRMFKPYPGEIAGVKKLMALLRGFPSRHVVEVAYDKESRVAGGLLNIVHCPKFTFQGLHEHRDTIRRRLLGIINDTVPAGHVWGKAPFIAVHVRLGDFRTVRNVEEIRSGVANSRIPLSWYVNVVRALRLRYPDMPVRIFSDGRDAELEAILSLGASVYRTGSDILDLLAMASASIFVGSNNSTYSRWAVLLGNMPSIWLDSESRGEQPSSPDTPILFIPLETREPVLWR